MRASLVLALVAVLFLAASACSSGSNPPGQLGPQGSSSSGGRSGSGSGSGSSGGGSGSSGSGSSGGSACVTASGCDMLQVCGPRVYPKANAGTFPTPAGGTVVPGTYVLTAIDVYGSGDTSWQRGVQQLTSMADAGPQMFQLAQASDVETDAGSGESVESATGSVFPNDATHLNFAYGCPGNGSVNTGYTATSTTLVELDPPSLVRTYTKQ